MALKSLCGQHPCPYMCVRVCHCPTGLARSKEQFAMYRNRRLAVRGGTSPQEPVSRTRPSPSQARLRHIDEITGEIFEPEHRLRLMTSQILTELIGAEEHPRRTTPLIIGRRLLQTYTTPLLLLLGILAVTAVTIYGLIINGLAIIPSYRADDVHTPPYWEENLNQKGELER